MLFSLLFLTVSAFASIQIQGVDVLTGKMLEIKPGAKGTVAIFMSAKCPCSNSHVTAIKTLAQEFKDFSFVAIHANADEDSNQTSTYFKNAGLPFPILQDDQGRLANDFKALKTPHAFVVAPDGKIFFKGGVTASHEADKDSKQFLRDALEDIQAGRAVRVKEARTLGCAISRSH